MFVGYFMYIENDKDFRKEPGHEYYLVQLFHEAENFSEPNAAGFVRNGHFASFSHSKKVPKLTEGN